MKTLVLEPIDVWLFRDGRPFERGVNHKAHSLFPPLPTVVQGAIRSHYLVTEGVDLADAAAIARKVGGRTDFGALRLRGPYVARRTKGKQYEPLFRVPADCGRCKEDRKVQTMPLTEKRVGVVTSLDGVLARLLYSHDVEPSKKPLGSWLTRSDLQLALQGKAVQPIDENELFVRDERVGIGLDWQTKTASDKLIYEAQFMCLKPNVGLLVGLDGYPNFPKNGVMKIGAEGRAASFYDDTGNALAFTAAPQRLKERFKLYFSTPAFFEKGWQPENWAKFFKGDVELVAVALPEGALAVSGFDFAMGKATETRHYVPAGSVYYFQQKTKGITVTWQDRLCQYAVTDFGAEIGFGQIFIAEW
jgi:CRISPR-associated protein Cmr3